MAEEVALVALLDRRHPLHLDCGRTLVRALGDEAAAGVADEAEAVTVSPSSS